MDVVVQGWRDLGTTDDVSGSDEDCGLVRLVQPLDGCEHDTGNVLSCVSEGTSELIGMWWQVG